MCRKTPHQNDTKSTPRTRVLYVYWFAGFSRTTGIHDVLLTDTTYSTTSAKEQRRNVLTHFRHHPSHTYCTISNNVAQIHVYKHNMGDTHVGLLKLKNLLQKDAASS